MVFDGRSAGWARVNRDRVELELLGFSGPSVNFKPMLGMVNFSTGAGNVYAETEDNVYLRVGNNWRAQPDAPRNCRIRADIHRTAAVGPNTWIIGNTERMRSLCTPGCFVRLLPPKNCPCLARMSNL